MEFKPFGQNYRRWLIGFLAATPVALGLSCWIAFQALCTFDAREAEFGELRFEGWRGNYSMLSSFAAEECELFVEIPGEGKFSIHQIPQEVRDRLFDKHTSDFDYDTAYTGTGDGWYLVLKYKDGELLSLT